MSTREVTHNEWSSFFETFSKQHEGSLATLEFFGDELGAQTEAVELPFAGISLNSDAGPQSLVINLGGTPGDHISHMVEHPRQVWLRQTEGANESIEIEEEDRHKTLLSFRSAQRPELRG